MTKRTDGRVCSHSPSSSLDMIALVCTSSAPNGSSISRIDGSLISAAASATRLRMPPESWWGWWSSNPDRPTRRSQSRALACACVLATPRKTGPSDTLPSTVFHGSSASAWNMKLVPSVMPSTGLAADPDRRPRSGGPGRRPASASSTCRSRSARRRRRTGRARRRSHVPQRGEGLARRREEPLGHPVQLDPCACPADGAAVVAVSRRSLPAAGIGCHRHLASSSSRNLGGVANRVVTCTTRRTRCGGETRLCAPLTR